MVDYAQAPMPGSQLLNPSDQANNNSSHQNSSNFDLGVNPNYLQGKYNITKILFIKDEVKLLLI